MKTASSFQKELEAFAEAVQSLRAADFNHARKDPVSDSEIRRTLGETFQLARKTLTSFFDWMCVTDINRLSARSVLQAAWRADMVIDEEAWLEMLRAWDETADQEDVTMTGCSLHRLETRYLPAFQHLLNELTERFTLETQRMQTWMKSAG